MSAAGAGSTSRRTPDELAAVGERIGLDGAALARASRLVAKVDSAAVQDGFELYLHGFIVADDGKWVVVQQGMNGASRHGAALSLAVGGAVELRRGAACGDRGADRRRDRQPDRPAGRRRRGRGAPELLASLGPDRLVREVAALEGRGGRRRCLPHLVMPAHHEVRPTDVVLRRLHGALAAAATEGPADFAELLMVPGVGARTVRALALVAEVVHGAPCRFADPGRFSLAHGRQGPASRSRCRR